MIDNIKKDNIVEDYKIGKTRVRISDKYCKDVTPEEVKKILKRIATMVQPALVAAEIEKMNKEGSDIT